MNLNEIRQKYSILTSGYFIEPQQLYHYTSPFGLEGILSKRSLFFTDSQFLNDYSERMEIYDFLKKAIREVDSSKNPTLYSTMKNHIENTETSQNESSSEIQNDTNFRFFVASFCLDADNLSMWNYYTKTPNSYGYNICFDWHMLQKALWDDTMIRKLNPVDYKNNGFKVLGFNMYGFVIYDDETKLKHLVELITDILEHKEPSEFPQNPIEIFKEIVRSLSLFFKNKAFSKENEYRFVIVSRNKELNSFRRENPENNLYTFRLCNGLFLPYINAPIIRSGTVEKVTVSPSVQQEIAMQGLEYFLFHNGYCPRVTKSEIPLRY